jgi:hypothetical protein
MRPRPRGLASSEAARDARSVSRAPPGSLVGDAPAVRSHHSVTGCGGAPAAASICCSKPWSTTIPPAPLMVGNPAITLTMVTRTVVLPTWIGKVAPRPCPVAAVNALVAAAGSVRARAGGATEIEAGSVEAGTPNCDGMMPLPGWNDTVRLVPRAAVLVTSGWVVTWPEPAVLDEVRSLPAVAAANGAPKPPVMLAAPRTDSMDSVATGTAVVGMTYCRLKPVMRSGYAASLAGATGTTSVVEAPLPGSTPACS